MPPFRHPAPLIALLLMTALPCAQAGTLDDFESHAQPASSSSAQTSHANGASSGGDGGLGEAFGQMCVGVLAAGGSESLRRVFSAPSTPDHRRDGEAMLPMLRYDLMYERVSANVDARHHRFEAGYGPVGFLYETSIYHERNPHDTLTFDRFLALYRMSMSDVVEVDLGFGRMAMNGNRNTTREVFSLPVRVQFSDGVGFDFRPTWSDGVDEYEGSLTLGGRFGTLSLGYRRMVAAGSSLEGPFAGFALHY